MKRSEFLAKFPPTPPPLPPANSPAPFPAPTAPPRPSPDDYFTRVEVRPTTFTVAPPPKRFSKGLVALGIACVVVAGGAAAFFTMRGGASAKHATPVVLAPRTATAGLPGSLSDVVRIQAEANRRAALQTVEQVGAGDVHRLEQMQPNFQWVDGSQPSTAPSIVSVTTSPVGDVTVAVSASNKDVCAFGRWSKYDAPSYVTIAHLPACTALAAPTAGWSREAGGAASDLPDENG